MNTKKSKTQFSKELLDYAHEKASWLLSVKVNETMSEESKRLFFQRECSNLIDDIISIAYYIKRKVK